MAIIYQKYYGHGFPGGVLSADQKAVEDATRKTLNKIAVQAYNSAGREARKIYNLSKSQWDHYTVLKLAKAYNNKIDFEIKGIKLPLFVFKPKIEFIFKTSKKGKKIKYTGVTVKVKKTGPRKLVESGFVGIMPNALVSIFKRAEDWEHRYPRQRAEKKISRFQSFGRGRRRKYLGITTIAASGKKHGLPIERKYTVSGPKMFEKEGEAELHEYVNNNIKRIFDDNLKFYLSKNR